MLSPIEPEKYDLINYSVENGTAFISINGTRGEQEGEIVLLQGENFVEAMTNLMQYHVHCYSSRLSGQQQEYVGPWGAHWANTSMVKWKVADAPLVDKEKGLLEEIVDAHNESVSDVATIERLRPYEPKTPADEIPF